MSEIERLVKCLRNNDSYLEKYFNSIIMNKG